MTTSVEEAGRDSLAVDSRREASVAVDTSHSLGGVGRNQVVGAGRNHGDSLEGAGRILVEVEAGHTERTAGTRPVVAAAAGEVAGNTG